MDLNEMRQLVGESRMAHAEDDDAVILKATLEAGKHIKEALDHLKAAQAVVAKVKSVEFDMSVRDNLDQVMKGAAGVQSALTTAARVHAHDAQR
jgi:hypothetical protein